MGESKSLASLSPTLLARKGGAKPAMRPHMQPLYEFLQDAAFPMGDDLGWYDIGREDAGSDTDAVKEGAQVVSISGDAVHIAQQSARPDAAADQAGQSTKRTASSAKSTPALSQGRRAAFTLRLDADRHFKLRLASVVLNRSAQQIVSEALDNHLAALADIKDFAAALRKGH